MDSRSTSPDESPRVAVSVVIPVFNSQDYLPRCLDSVLEQTLTDLEIVAVDDGSTDDSLAVLRCYELRDPRVQVVRHERNVGLHVARMTGAEASRGLYVGYVDSDDHIASDMFSSMYDAAMRTSADVVRTGAWLLEANADGTEPTVRGTIACAEGVYDTGVEYLDADFYPAMWLHLHHRRLWTRARPFFPRVRLLGEDNLTSFVLAFFAGRVVTLSAPSYYYIERQDSLSGGVSLGSVTQHIRDRRAIVEMLRTFLATQGERTTRCLPMLEANNRGLLFWYIDNLQTAADRVHALTLYEQLWGEEAPADRRRAWLQSRGPSS